MVPPAPIAPVAPPAPLTLQIRPPAPQPAVELPPVREGTSPGSIGDGILAGPPAPKGIVPVTPPAPKHDGTGTIGSLAAEPISARKRIIGTEPPRLQDCPVAPAGAGLGGTPDCDEPGDAS